MSTPTNSQEVAKPTEFSDLPFELRTKIWKMAVQAPRKIAIGRTLRLAPGEELDLWHWGRRRPVWEDYALIVQPQYPLRAINANYESREVTLPLLRSSRPVVDFADKERRHWVEEANHRPPLPIRVVNNGHFDPSQDTIVLKEGFLSKGSLLDFEECGSIFNCFWKWQYYGGHVILYHVQHVEVWLPHFKDLWPTPPSPYRFSRFREDSNYRAGMKNFFDIFRGIKTLTLYLGLKTETQKVLKSYRREVRKRLRLGRRRLEHAHEGIRVVYAGPCTVEMLQKSSISDPFPEYPPSRSR